MKTAGIGSRFATTLDLTNGHYPHILLESHTDIPLKWQFGGIMWSVLLKDTEDVWLDLGGKLKWMCVLLHFFIKEKLLSKKALKGLVLHHQQIGWSTDWYAYMTIIKTNISRRVYNIKYICFYFGQTNCRISVMWFCFFCVSNKTNVCTLLILKCRISWLMFHGSL